MQLETFMRQIVNDKSIRRLKILVPFKFSSRNKLMNAVSQNEHIEEITIMFNPEVLNYEKRYYGHLDLALIFCKRGLKIVNIDIGELRLTLVLLALFERRVSQNTVEMIRVLNF